MPNAAGEFMYTVIDVETTGTSARNGHIIEISIFKTDGTAVVDEFTSLVNPEVYVPSFISHLTGITQEMVESAPRFCEIAKRIVEITEGCVFVAHNARFDYSFVREEFSRLAYNFRRKQLCTVRLARQIVPGHPTYSLGPLVKALGFTHNSPHRARGDAEVTTELFHHLLRLQSDDLFEHTIEKEIAETRLPPNMTREDIDAIPEECGVYYFLGEDDELLYVGKSRNIYKRVLQHIGNDLRSKRAMQMKERTRRITWDLTGSELVALLLESQQIRELNPEFNRTRHRSYPASHGLYATETDGEYTRLEIRSIEKGNEPAIPFSSHKMAVRTVDKMIEDFDLCDRMAGRYAFDRSCFRHQTGRCGGACIGEEDVESYNERVRRALQHYRYEHPHFLVVGPGRKHHENSVVSVENGVYRGFGYFEPDYVGSDLDEIRSCIHPFDDNRHTQSIIRSWMRKKHAGHKVIKYDAAHLVEADI